MEQNKRKWALFHRRECLIPTRRAWVIFAALFLLGGILFVRGIHSFLAVTNTQRGGVLIVEGWLPDYALEQAIVEFRVGGYERVYVTGGPMDLGGPLSSYSNYADLSAAILVRMGMPREKLQPVPAPRVKQDRTYTSAVTLRRWLQTNSIAMPKATIITEGTHARRSRLLFQKALGDQTKVGIIAIPPEDYEPPKWWASSQGVRVVLSEFLAYGYARFLFWPSNPQ